MPKKASGNFNQAKYMQEWAKENMSTVMGKYSKDFVNEFKQACKVLGISQSQVIREAMIKTIEEAKKVGD